MAIIQQPPSRAMSRMCDKKEWSFRSPTAHSVNRTVGRGLTGRHMRLNKNEVANRGDLVLKILREMRAYISAVQRLFVPSDAASRLEAR